MFIIENEKVFHNYLYEVETGTCCFSTNFKYRVVPENDIGHNIAALYGFSALHQRNTRFVWPFHSETLHLS